MNEIDRGNRAQALLDDETLQQAFADVREAILGQIESCPLRDTEGAEKLRLMLKLLRDLQANLETAVSNGKLAEVELNHSQDKRRWFGA